MNWLNFVLLRKPQRLNRIKIWVVAAMTMIGSTGALAMPSYQFSGGLLTGIKGIDVGGYAVDVEFVDGELQSLYGLSDPFFFGPGGAGSAVGLTAANGALAIFNALMDGPEGNFDSNPELVFGCAGDNCRIHVPYLYDTISNSIPAQWFRNAANDADDEAGSSDNLITFNSIGNADVYTVWQFSSEVVEPSTGLLFALGGMALVFSQRKFKHGE